MQAQLYAIIKVTASSALVAILAFVLIGKGVAALQKVGVIDMTPIAFPKIDLLGIYPSVQTIDAQVFVLLVIIISAQWNLRTQKQQKVMNQENFRK